jgi:hypothetical protein
MTIAIQQGDTLRLKPQGVKILGRLGFALEVVR